MIRSGNEDAIAVNNEIFTGNLEAPYVVNLDTADSHVLMVADGMGGHAQGALASRKALKNLSKMHSELFDPARCAIALEKTNHYLYDIMYENPDASGLGTTIVGFAFRDFKICFFNVGDSRLYKYGNQALTQLTHDDALTSKTGPNKKKTHMITQSLGGQYMRRSVEPHTGFLTVDHGEVLLLCSDGLTDMVDDKEILNIVKGTSCPQKATKELFNYAMLAGGADNISIIVAKV